jgi:CHAT domain-containing protein
LITADAFTAQSLQDASLHKFRTIHLATHAVASTLDPTECGIIASHDERIGIDRVMHLPLTDALVVLSACRTGEGEAVPGQGIVGLTWATMLAGARGVIASQWSVDDAASARLMLSLHQHLKAGIDPVHALALAQRESRATQKNPAIWAAHMAIVRAAAPDAPNRRTPNDNSSQRQ